MTRVLAEAPEEPLLFLCGHEHYDHFYVYRRGDTGGVVAAALVPNSIVPSHNFPGFRMYAYDPGGRRAVDYVQYGCNITDAQATGRVTCEELYRYGRMYGLPDLSPGSVAEQLARLRGNRSLAERYVELQNFGEPVSARCRDDACVDSRLDDAEKIIFWDKKRNN